MRILITGTTGGIGGALRDEALALGHEVVELNRGDFASLDAALEAAGPVDALIYSTGTCPVTPLGLLSDAVFEETFRVNCGLFVKLMRSVVKGRRYGRNGLKAVAISSVSATEGWPGGAAYCASKGALSAVCRALDAELRARGVSVTAVEPRHVRTRMFERGAGRMGVGSAEARDPREFARELLGRVTSAGDHGRGGE